MCVGYNLNMHKLHLLFRIIGFTGIFVTMYLEHVFSQKSEGMWGPDLRTPLVVFSGISISILFIWLSYRKDVVTKRFAKAKKP